MSFLTMINQDIRKDGRVRVEKTYTLRWSVGYASEKKFFAYKWVCKGIKTGVKDYEMFMEIKGQKMPSGIEIVDINEKIYYMRDEGYRKTDCGATFPACNSYQNIEEVHSAEVSIRVSDTYTNNIYKDMTAQKIVFEDTVPVTMIPGAQRFKERLVERHSSLIALLEEKTALKAISLKSSGFVGNDNSIPFTMVEMKPLEEPEKRIGLILALIERKVTELRSNEIFSIGLDNNGEVRWSRREIYKDSNFLNNW